MIFTLFNNFKTNLIKMRNIRSLNSDGFGSVFQFSGKNQEEEDKHSEKIKPGSSRETAIGATDLPAPQKPKFFIPDNTPKIETGEKPNQITIYQNGTNIKNNNNNQNPPTLVPPLVNEIISSDQYTKNLHLQNTDLYNNSEFSMILNNLKENYQNYQQNISTNVNFFVADEQDCLINNEVWHPCGNQEDTCENYNATYGNFTVSRNPLGCMSGCRCQTGFVRVEETRACLDPAEICQGYHA